MSDCLARATAGLLVLALAACGSAPVECPEGFYPVGDVCLQQEDAADEP